MYKRLFLILGLLTLFAANSLAQNGPNTQTPAPVKLSASTDNFDPLGILEDDEEDEKALGVKASVLSMVSFERAAFEIINRKRVENGQPHLTWCDKLAAVARVHSQSMAEFRFFSHRGLDDKLVSDRADRQGVGRWRSIGENIAFNRGYKDPVEKAVEGWLNSPTHRRNMLDTNWKESAVGVALAPDGSYYFTQVFLTRK